MGESLHGISERIAKTMWNFRLNRVSDPRNGFKISPVLESLYVHIPFCPKLCPYCSFFSEVTDRNKTQRFLESLITELEREAAAREIRPKTIFFGGGTPSALSTPQLDWLLSRMKDRLDLSALEEWTIEMNPATVSLEKASMLRQHGVNRISMGVQSWDPVLLETLGRVHSADQAERSYRILREAGFSAVNLDFMFGVPGQTPEVWRSTLERTIELAPDHISAYCLTYEEDTEYFDRMTRGEYKPDGELDAALFETTASTLESAGYRQYEISNFAKPGFECRHNLAYWQGRNYLGIGPSAFSTVDGMRWANVANTEAYIEAIDKQAGLRTFEEALEPAVREKEMLSFSLRTVYGVEISPDAAWHSDFLGFEEEGLVVNQSGRWVTTRRGKIVADALAESFY